MELALFALYYYYYWFNGHLRSNAYNSGRSVIAELFWKRRASSGVLDTKELIQFISHIESNSFLRQELNTE